MLYEFMNVRLGESGISQGHAELGLWLLSGLFAFAALERILSCTAEAGIDGGRADHENDVDVDSDSQNNNDADHEITKKTRPLTTNDTFNQPNPPRGISSKRVRIYYFTFINK